MRAAYLQYMRAKLNVEVGPDLDEACVHVFFMGIRYSGGTFFDGGQTVCFQLSFVCSHHSVVCATLFAELIRMVSRDFIGPSLVYENLHTSRTYCVAVTSRMYNMVYSCKH